MVINKFSSLFFSNCFSSTNESIRLIIIDILVLDDEAGGGGGGGGVWVCFNWDGVDFRRELWLSSEFDWGELRCSSDEWEFSLKNSSVLIYFIVIGESSSGHIGEDEWICSKLHFRFSDMRSNLEEDDEENVDGVFFCSFWSPRCDVDLHQCEVKDRHDVYDEWNSYFCICFFLFSIEMIRFVRLFGRIIYNIWEPLLWMSKRREKKEEKEKNLLSPSIHPKEEEMALHFILCIL